MPALVLRELARAQRNGQVDAFPAQVQIGVGGDATQLDVGVLLLEASNTRQ